MDSQEVGLAQQHKATSDASTFSAIYNIFAASSSSSNTPVKDASIFPEFEEFFCVDASNTAPLGNEITSPDLHPVFARGISPKGDSEQNATASSNEGNISLPVYRDKRKSVINDFPECKKARMHAGASSTSRHKDGEASTINTNLNTVGVDSHSTFRTHHKDGDVSRSNANIDACTAVTSAHPTFRTRHKDGDVSKVFADIIDIKADDAPT